ncbi:LRIF1 factor, partial [Campylorhamphus procurvoides]|nr:LRIF1 factor [Campylorhamphus procurvoides]
SSIAGCMYRVVQTPGPDGKNLLKLLPLSKPSGGLVPLLRSPAMPNSPKGNISCPVHLTFKTQLGNPATPSSLQIFQSPNPGKILLTRPLEKPEGARVGAEKEAVAVSGSSAPSYMLVNTNPLPVTVKSPALPLGHHLQIPADAEVRSVPASLLPPAIQQKILAAATAAPDGAKMPTVIYVSPVNTVKTPQVLPKHLQPFCPPGAPEVSKALVVTAAPRGGGPDPAEGPRRRQSPMKWIVQETATLSAPCLIPVKSSNDVASKILKTLSDTRNVEGSPANILPLCSGTPAQAKITPLKDNALVMYNGKVYLLTKRGSDILTAQADRDPPPKEPPKPHRVDPSAVNKITSKVVSLVLSKSKAMVLAQKEPNPRADPSRDPQGSPAALVTPSADQQDCCATPKLELPCTGSVSSTGDIPVPAAATQGGQDGAPQGEQEGALREDWPKIQWEHTDSPGEAKTQHQEQPHWKQFLELRRKFGLFKEERVCLRRIPLIEDTWENPEEGNCCSDSLERKSDSCSWSSLDVELRNHLLEGVKEEKVPVDLEEDLARKRKAKSSPGSDSRKRRRTSPRSTPSPPLEPPNALPRGPSPPPASPEPTIPMGCSPASQGREWEPDTPPECREGPVLAAPAGDPSLPEGSFRDDAFPAAPPELDETIRDEKIKRLKQLLREREAALEEMRRE